MKKITILIAVLAVFAQSRAQGNSMTILKNNIRVYEQSVSNIDSVVYKVIADTVKDIDGNVYRTVTFDFGNGSKVTWMAENLKTTKLNDGTPITEVKSENARYENGTNSGNYRMTPAFCWHMNYAYNKEIYGALYNHLAVQTGKLAPAGWHVATNAEWIALEALLAKTGGNWDGTISADGVATKVAKAMAGQFTWNSTTTAGQIGCNTNANNKSGLSLVACGYRDGVTYGQTGQYGFYWTGTKSTTGSATVIGTAYSRNISSGQVGFDAAGQAKLNGIQLLFGVRCVRNTP